ncbi:MAG: 30S ribosomal protein S20 [Chlamydiia bacterium]|jgi:small subunit ribosomal protein S20|nr:30S ribosomal protein S20 [Chlamydiota bacterium]
MAEDKKKIKVRRPSALKRDLQSEKKRLRNKTYKSTVSSAIKSFQTSLSQKDIPATQDKFQLVCSLMDKGVKKGIFPKNKANRTKSTLSQKVSA